MKGEIAFLAKFFSIFGVLQLALVLLDLSFIQNGIAGIEAYMIGAESFGNAILLGGNYFSIVSNCTGLVSVSALAAIVFSLRKPGIRLKAAIFLACSALLLAINLLRIYIVLLIAVSFGPEIGEYFHIVSWFFMLFVIIGAWYYSTKRIAKVEEFEGFA